MAILKNLIFDLGGVILDLSVIDSLESFARLSGLSLEKVKELFVVSPEFEQFERGEINDREFRDFVRRVYDISASDRDLDRCWNAMLLGIPKTKLDLLLELKTQYKVFLLSNTNHIHLNYINSILLPPLASVDSLDPYFHRCYYSHLMGKRKPEASIFRQVLDENGLSENETLFLDDNADNIAAAQALGIQTVHVTHPDVVIKYFNK